MTDAVPLLPVTVGHLPREDVVEQGPRCLDGRGVQAGRVSDTQVSHETHDGPGLTAAATSFWPAGPPDWLAPPLERLVDGFPR